MRMFQERKMRKIIVVCLTILLVTAGCVSEKSKVENNHKRIANQRKLTSKNINDRFVKTDLFKSVDVLYTNNLYKQVENFALWEPQKSNFKGELVLKASKPLICEDNCNIFVTPEGFVFKHEIYGREFRDFANLEYQLNHNEEEGLFEINGSRNIVVSNYKSNGSFGYKDQIFISCVDYKTNNVYWKTFVDESFNDVNLIGIIGNYIIVDSFLHQFLVLDLATGNLLNLIDIVGSGTFIFQKATKKYYWFVLADIPSIEQEPDDPSLYRLARYNPETNEINEFKMNGANNLIYLDEKLYVGNAENKFYLIDEETGKDIATYNISEKIEKVNEILQFDAAIEVYTEKTDYLYKPDGKLLKFAKNLPEYKGGYYTETENSFFGLDENTGNKTWEIKKSNFEKDPKILNIDSRGVLVADWHQVYLFKP